MNSLLKLLAVAAVGLSSMVSLLRADRVASGAEVSGIRTHGTNVQVTVRFSVGTRRVTLESRSRFTRGTWTPRGVVMPGNAETETVFTVPMSSASEALRAVVDDSESLPLPAPFYSGLRTFEAQVSTNRPNVVNPTGIFPGVADGGNMAVLPGTPPNGDRTVSESDIWKFSGNRLYFFNQLRGLQVLDVSAPAAPRLIGRLPLTSYGEQMYVLPAPLPGGDWLALITQMDCQWDSTAVQLVRSIDGLPVAGPRVEVPGRTLESRLIGDVLVLATQGWSNRTVLLTNVSAGIRIDPSRISLETGNPVREGLVTNVYSQVLSEAFTQVTTVDLADPAQPVVRSSLRAPFTPTAIHATDRLLFVSTYFQETYWMNTIGSPSTPPTNSVLVFDVSDPTGILRQTGSFNTAGRIADKFKFGLDGEVLSVVSQIEGRWREGSGRFEPPVVVLETFSLANLSVPVQLGRLNLVTNENVFATRFDAGRAYVVTFRQVDPLWIVDLSNPAQPRVQGELEVPGWSTYIEPMGDRLLAMGAEQGRAAVSLFDVANPAAPALLSKVYLGDGWSWSEANADEKAFRVFADRNLALLPWHGRQGTNGWFQGMQLLEFTRSSLALRGTISHDSTARRATLLGENVLSLSSGELVSADISNRDQPLVRSVVDLSRPVDRVFELGDHLVQIATGRWNNGSQEPGPLMVGLSTREDPDSLISSLALTNSPLIGADFRDGFLYLLQRANDSYRMESVLQTNSVVAWRNVPPLLRTVTNETVRLVPQPPVQVCTETVRTVQFPASPTSPAYWTNFVIRTCTEEPRPPVFRTNQVVVHYEEWQPPVLETNRVVFTNQVVVPVPGTTTLQVVAVDAAGLRPRGSTSVPNTLDGWGGSWKTAHWPSAGTIVFAASGGGSYFPVFMADMGFSVVSLPWGYNGGSSELLAFDVTHSEAPILASRIELDRSDSRRFFLAGSKLFASVSTSEWIAPVDGTTGGPPVIWWSRFGSWHTRHSLQVVDYADPSEPVVRASVPLPGELLGLSHQGNLLYARTNSLATTGVSKASLLALAYDGVGASLVSTRDLPDGGNGPVSVRPDGKILVGLRSRAVVETWALSREGTLEIYGSANLPTVANRFLEIGNRVVAEGDEVLALLDTTGTSTTVSGVAARPCSVWLDPSTAAVSGADALWIPRGEPGLWRVSFGAP